MAIDSTDTSAVELWHSHAPNLRDSIATIDILNDEYQIVLTEDEFTYRLTISTENPDYAFAEIIHPSGQVTEIYDVDKVEEIAKYLLPLAFGSDV